VRLATLDKREALITAIWCAKESALKALRLGLTIDTWRVHGRAAVPITTGWSSPSPVC
jgi:phosphopantetheinyl transferase (holo-ACP synthase)